MARHRLAKLRLNFVSLVDVGDNGPAEVVIHKSRSAHNLVEDPHATTAGGMPNTDVQSTGQLGSDALDGLPDEVAKYITDLETHALTLEDKVAKMEKDWPPAKSAKSAKDDNDDDEEDDEVEKVLKGASPELAAVIRKQQQQLAEVQKVAQQERDLRLVAKFRDTARTEFSHLGKEDEIGAVLKAASEQLSEDSFSSLVSVLKRANAGMSELFTETGYVGSTDTSLSRLDAALAKARQADPALGEAEALAKALEEDPQAYDAWNRQFMNKGSAR